MYLLTLAPCSCAFRRVPYKSCDELGRLFPRVRDMSDRQVAQGHPMMSTPSVTSVSVHPRRYGDYVLLESLGHGGMSEVDLARRSVDRAGFVRFLVIKRILPKNTTDPTFLRMFVDEARINAELQHENIAQVYDFGERHGEWYLAMEYVPGVDLRRIQKKVAASGDGNGLLPPRIALRILHDVLAALHYAHNRVDTYGQPMRIVHRDVNPRNIMVSIRGEVKLIDFGVAKADTRHDQTTGQTIKGKFAYMAPEQIESPKPVDGRADLFAVGLLLQELLTGTHPFRNLTEIQIIHRLMAARIDPMGDPPGYPDLALVHEVRNRAMAPNPDERYPDARQFQDDLVRLAAPLGGLASRSEVAGFFRRVDPDGANQISARLTAWKDTDAASGIQPAPEAPPATPQTPEETWSSEVKPVPSEPGTIADSVAAFRVADATVADTNSASSVVMPHPPPARQLSLVGAVAIGGGLGLLALAALVVVVLVVLPDRQSTPTVLAPQVTSSAAKVDAPQDDPAPPPEADTTSPEPPAVDKTSTAKAGADKSSTEKATTDKSSGTKSSTDKTSAAKSTSSAPPPTATKDPPATTPSTERTTPPAGTSAAPESQGSTTPSTTPPSEPSRSEGTSTAPEPTASKKEERPPAAQGFLFATSRPSGLEVLVGGKKLGNTPLRSVPLPAGQHTIVFRDAVTGKTSTKSVTIDANQSAVIQAQIE